MTFKLQIKRAYFEKLARKCLKMPTFVVNKLVDDYDEVLTANDLVSIS